MTREIITSLVIGLCTAGTAFAAEGVVVNYDTNPDTGLITTVYFDDDDEDTDPDDSGDIETPSAEMTREIQDAYSEGDGVCYTINIAGRIDSWTRGGCPPL